MESGTDFGTKFSAPAQLWEQTLTKYRRTTSSLKPRVAETAEKTTKTSRVCCHARNLRLLQNALRVIDLPVRISFRCSLQKGERICPISPVRLNRASHSGRDIEALSHLPEGSKVSDKPVLEAAILDYYLNWDAEICTLEGILNLHSKLCTRFGLFLTIDQHNCEVKLAPR